MPRLIIDSLNFAHHVVNLCDDPSDFSQFSQAFFFLSIKYWRELNPTDIVYAMDKGSFRYNLFPEYKSGRKKAREKILETAKETNIELKPSFHTNDVFKIGNLLQAIGINFVFVQNYEADDIIASLVNRREQQQKQIILSTDSDYEQLIVDENVAQYRYNFGWNTLDKIKEKYNGRIGEDILNIKAMHGDTSDSIDGIAGIGIKTALKLLDTHGTFEGIDSYVQQGAKEKKLRENWNLEKVIRNKNIMKMVSDVPFEYSPSTFKIQPDAVQKFQQYNIEKVFNGIKDYYAHKKISQYNFKSLWSN